MQLDIRDECHADPFLIERIHTITREVTDEIVNVSGLLLPPRVQIRLLTPRAFRRLNVDHFNAMMDMVVKRNPELPKPLVGAVRLLAGMNSRLLVRIGWRGIGGQFFPALNGGAPTIVIVPKAINAAHGNENELRVTIPHELTHAAQEHAHPLLSLEGLSQTVHALADDQSKTKISQLPQFSSSVEGHAQWVHLRVTRNVYGVDLRERETRFNGKGSAMFRVAKVVCKLHPAMVAKSADYDKGERFVEAVYQAGGLLAVNRLWDGIEMMPTKAELRDVDAWMDRIKQVA